jgi:dihydropteroate synthase
MADTVAATGAGVVLMHSRSRPQDMQIDTSYKDLLLDIFSFLEESVSVAEASGIYRERIVIDPGIGFGKDLNGNLEIIRRLKEFLIFNLPILIGTSRKSFIGKIIDRPVDERLFGIAATVAAAVINGASIIRVHDISSMRDVTRMALAIRDGFDPSAIS